MIEICSIGGYDEVGGNSTAVKVDDEVYIFDLGIYLENYIPFTQDEDTVTASSDELMNAGAIPKVSVINHWKDKVKMILSTHAHLDHIGAIPFLLHKYNAPVMCTPFTAEVLKAMMEDAEVRTKNPIKSMQSNSSAKVSDKVTVEFIHVTHSTPHTVVIALHTPDGIILYANDFKFDLSPTLGKKPNFKRLQEIGALGVKVLIVDSTYAPDPRKMPSEAIAKQKLRDVLIDTPAPKNAIIVTTFSSHIARLNSIVEFGGALNRKIIFLGRSLAKYVEAAERSGIIEFSKYVEIVKYSSQIKKRLARIEKEGKPSKYLLVVTGHQGEPRSTLSKIINGDTKFHIRPGDHVVFSSRVIPTPTNIKNSEKMDATLKSYHARIFRDVHESGHAAREDLRDFIMLVKPKHIIPAHGVAHMKEALAELAAEMGYQKGKNVHLMKNGEFVRV